jgi:hypothetical protein
VEIDLWKKLKGAAAGAKGSPQPGSTPPTILYTTINEFITGGEQLTSWREAKLSLIAGQDTMDISELRKILETNLPGVGPANCIEMLDKVYKDRSSKLVSTVVRQLRGIKKRIPVRDLLTNVHSDRLAQLLGNRSEVTVADLAMLLP